jgi:hypothetical protein
VAVGSSHMTTPGKPPSPANHPANPPSAPHEPDLNRAPDQPDQPPAWLHARSALEHGASQPDSRFMLVEDGSTSAPFSAPERAMPPDDLR